MMMRALCCAAALALALPTYGCSTQKPDAPKAPPVGDPGAPEDGPEEPLVATEGPPVSADFVAFVGEDAKVMVSNRGAADLSQLRVRMHFLRADRSPVTAPGGQAQTFPIGRAVSVGPGKQRALMFPARQPEGSVSARITVEAAVFADGNRFPAPPAKAR